MDEQKVIIPICTESGELITNVSFSLEEYDSIMKAAQKRKETLQEFLEQAVNEYINERR